MDRETLERLLAKEADGELASDERLELERQLEADEESARLAASWRKTSVAIDGFMASLGTPSPEARREGLSYEPPRASARGRIRSYVALAAAAGLVLAVGTGFGIGAAVYAPRSAGPEAAAFDVGPLRDALRETRQLMPRRVRWTALCNGRLKLGTSPLPVDNKDAYHFATFVLERSDRERPMLCQVAVLDGEDARVEWESDGQWVIECIPVVDSAGGGVRLATTVTYRPAETRHGLTLSAEPLIAEGEMVSLVSSRIGGVTFSVSVVVRTEGSARPKGGVTL